MITECVACTHVLYSESQEERDRLSAREPVSPAFPERSLVLGSGCDGVLIRVLQTNGTSRVCNYISLHLYISLSPHGYLSFPPPQSISLSSSSSSSSLSLAKEIHYKELAYVIVTGDSGRVAAAVPV